MQGLEPQTAQNLMRCDTAPLNGSGFPVQDGVIGAGDMLIIEQKVSGL
jgi:hypothetical protein